GDERRRSNEVLRSETSNVDEFRKRQLALNGGRPIAELLGEPLESARRKQTLREKRKSLLIPDESNARGPDMILEREAFGQNRLLESKHCPPDRIAQLLFPGLNRGHQAGASRDGGRMRNVHAGRQLARDPDDRLECGGVVRRVLDDARERFER